MVSSRFLRLLGKLKISYLVSDHVYSTAQLQVNIQVTHTYDCNPKDEHNIFFKYQKFWPYCNNIKYEYYYYRLLFFHLAYMHIIQFFFDLNSSLSIKVGKSTTRICIYNGFEVVCILHKNLPCQF